MLGRVLDVLERSPARDNTIVVLWSDHGWHLGDKEHWQKFTPWRICGRPVSLVDLFGTLTDLCGLPAKAGIESRSLVPLLRDPGAPWPHAAFTHLDRPENYAISTQHWRYIHYRGDQEELYDIETDPYEWTNLASKPEHAAKLAEMRAFAPKQVAPIHATTPGINDFVAQVELAPVTGVEIPHSKAGGERISLLFQNHKQIR